ncbi:hypothetical protein VMCG_00686 [Cytospora schulzeri]|uniref:Uncharacterized protein n=1 Tax=Cytospora schulzeri TaxID=448051 RepID=A0A423X9W4_9PEZI|nr:hypothetical protein VMCG_00686 [Valsa malicola]
MTQQPVPEARRRASSTKQGELPDEVTQILVKSLQLGAGAGGCGMLFGATAGIIRLTPAPLLFSLVTGFQWFGLSSVFYGTRKVAIARLGPEHTVTPAQKVGASAIAGAASVVPVGLLLRGPRSILPGAVVFSLLGAGGQFAANKWSASEGSSEKKSSWLDRKWSPMTRLSDEQYENILEEKVLRLEAEIAIIDEDLTALKAQKEAQKAAEDVAMQSPLRGDKT